MNKFHNLIELARAIANNPKGTFTFIGARNAGGGDIETLDDGKLRHTDRYETSLEVPGCHVYAIIEKEWFTDKNYAIGGVEHPAPPTEQECIDALHEVARLRAIKLRDDIWAHAGLLAAVI